MVSIKRKASEYGKCQKCNSEKHLSELYSYVDGNNISITKNSPILCENCYYINYTKMNKIQLDFIEWLSLSKFRFIKKHNFWIRPLYSNSYNTHELFELYKKEL